MIVHFIRGQEERISFEDMLIWARILLQSDDTKGYLATIIETPGWQRPNYNNQRLV